VLGSAVIMGLLVATLFGVFLVPVLFVGVERIVRYKWRWRRRPAPAPQGPAPHGTAEPA
jgi:hypothetical protein